MRYPPSLYVAYPRNHTTVEGVNLILQCRVTAANPEPNVTCISRSDAGQYYCVVENGIGPAVTSGISTVDVQYSPSLDINYPHDNTVVEGENLTLQCKVTSANPESVITWYSVTANNTILSSGVNMTFINISRTLAGEYFCVARNGIGKSAVSRKSVIKVLYPPFLDPSYPRDHSVSDGESVSLRCVVKASNPHPNITWIKLSNPGKVLSSNPILNLTSVVHADDGDYRCLAENGVGGQIWSRVAKVKVQLRKKGGKEEGENEPQKSEGRRLIIILLSLAVAVLTVGILLMAILCVCVHRTSGLSTAAAAAAAEPKTLKHGAQIM
ncbi:carbohydrate binding [Desmophyllum pertusum]|uniref:Carbohydrate binding n=1 Tax=Desmophyllum pertusum TaxID=174260 RepID=A0A9W9ZKF4_9CNID|nr:carbohydrate binding [Desmophyllum pertusum]